MGKKFQRKRAPYDPAYSRFMLHKARKTQADLARELNITPASVSTFLDDRAYSQRFWDHFMTVTLGVRDVA